MVKGRKPDRKTLGLADARVRKCGGREGEWVGTGLDMDRQRTTEAC